ncbi:MAG: hypothetical protein KGJ66_03080 [Alphaproteobacteria bacterium]|nr:hypothetical protein [Alphaproteobacteria bacterium]
MHTGRLLLSVLVLAAWTASARAETLELSCTLGGGSSEHISINLTNSTECDFCPPCTLCYPVRITDRAFYLHSRIVIDRMSGQIIWVTGATGTCTPLKQRF